MSEDLVKEETKETPEKKLGQEAKAEKKFVGNPYRRSMRVVGELDGKELLGVLGNPMEEIIMVKEMLASKETLFTPQGQAIEISTYSGKQRSFLRDRLFDLMYIEKEQDAASGQE